MFLLLPFPFALPLTGQKPASDWVGVYIPARVNTLQARGSVCKVLSLFNLLALKTMLLLLHNIFASDPFCSICDLKREHETLIPRLSMSVRYTSAHTPTHPASQRVLPHHINLVRR